MTKEYAVYLPVDNSEPEIVEFQRSDDGTMDLGWCYEKIGCDLIDIVGTISEDVCLVVDDEGLLKPEPSMNILASVMYGFAQHGQPIVGGALLCKNHLDEDGLRTVGFPKEEAERIVKSFVPLRIFEVDED